MRIFILGLTLLCVNSAQAWQVESHQGVAFLEFDAQKVPIDNGMQIKPGQIIRTGNEGRVQLKEGTGQIWVSANSAFKIDNFVANAGSSTGSGNGTGGKAVLSIMFGKARARFEHKASDPEVPYVIKMKSVVAGVRGTEFFGAVDDENEKVCTLEGHVVVTSLGEDKTVWELPAGKGLFISKGKAPEVKSTSSDQVETWVLATSTPNVYALPFQLRPVAISNSLRFDSAQATYLDKSGNSGGSAAASVITGSYKYSDRTSLVARGGFNQNNPPAGASSGTTYTNVLLGAQHLPDAGPYLKHAGFLGVTLPVGTGSGNTPDAGVKAANLSGMLARSAMDNALFAVNYTALVAGADVAYVRDGWTMQLEATLFELMRVSGELVDKDAERMNFTTGGEVGYAATKSFSMIGELHYQRWLSNATVFAAANAPIDNLSYAIGPRFNFVWGEYTFKPGLAYERGLIGPMVSGAFPTSVANNEQILFLDIPVVF